MTIWVGHDGTLNDDDGDGPAVGYDPMVALEAEEAEVMASGFGYPGVYPGHFHGYPGHYVGQDDFGSALGSIGSALGSAFGGSGGAGGGAGGGGGGGFDFGSLGSSFGSALGSGDAGGSGGGDTGSAIANIFGQVAKVAVPAATQAISRAAQSHPQAQAQTQTQAPAGTSTTPPTVPVQRPAGMTTQHPSQQPHPRKQHAVDPKTKLNLMLTHLGKKYGMTPPAGGGGAAGADSGKTTLANVGSFVQNMMGGPKTDGTGTATTGEYAGDLGSLFSHRPILHEHMHAPFGLHLDIPLERRFERTYPAYQAPRRHQYVDQGYVPSYPYYPDQGYAIQQGYARQQAYAQPPATYGQSQDPYAQQQGMTSSTPAQQTRSPVTYQPYPMPDGGARRRSSFSSMDVGPIESSRSREGSSSSMMEVGPLTVTHPDQSKMVQVSATAPRGGNVGKFVSKMMGGPGAHPAMVPDEDLRGIQRLMNQYYATKVLQEDGIMGDETHRILRQFQETNGIPKTGIPDAATRKVLKLEQERQGGAGATQMQETLQSAFGGTAAVMHGMDRQQDPAVSGLYGTGWW